MLYCYLGVTAKCHERSIFRALLCILLWISPSMAALSSQKDFEYEEHRNMRNVHFELGNNEENQ